MYFHLIGIKEQDGQQYPLDLLIGDNEEVVIKEFLGKWKVVVVSLTSYLEPIEKYGTIKADITVDSSDFFIIFPQKQFENEGAQVENGEEQVKSEEGLGDPLEKALRFLFSLGLLPKTVNFLQTPVADTVVADLIKKISLEYQESRALWEEQQQKKQQEEQKRYEDDNLRQALKVINTNVDRIVQLLEVGRGIISFDEEKTLTDLSNELKKIRLGSNFNRMVQLLMETQDRITAAENKVLKQLDDKKFLIDRHSNVTNIDVISEYAELTRAQEKSLLKQQLHFSENLYLSGKNITIFAKFFGKDLKAAFSSFQMFLPNMLGLLEYLVLVIIVILSAFWIFSSLFSGDSSVPYYLPMFGRLGLLLYLYNQCTFTTTLLQVAGFVVLLGLYVGGVMLIQSTFAF